MNTTTCTNGAIIGDPKSSATMSPQTALLEAFFPGFALLSSALDKYANINLSLYVPSLLAIAGLLFASKYVTEYFWQFMNTYFMSSADIRVDDEMYNMVMAWVSQQGFAKRSRRFVANVNLNSRNWFLWYDSNFSGDGDEDEDEDLELEDDTGMSKPKKRKEKALQYTPSFGTHYFWYKGHVLIFQRSKNTQQSYVPVSEREEISISSFGRNPTVLKELLDECRANFSKNDENKTLIYRGTLKSGTAEVQWVRCMSRVSRPFSTVVLDESVKKSLLEDISSYIKPSTRRWYSNRGIPYRRGFLLFGPPGTGKSSLSFAIAGYFNLKIYIVSLNSLAMNEENLGTLFSELPTKCVVLLEDIDTAGLTHTRDKPEPIEDSKKVTTIPAGATPGVPTTNSTGGRISLSALLNILDGVASQEGRILLMTTNHIEKLDPALIRPGRVDMKVKFKLATSAMIKTIFCAIFATLEGDYPAIKKKVGNSKGNNPPEISEAARKEAEEEKERKRKAEEARVSALSDAFAALIPADTFSPAEIQGYLLNYKREAELAIANAAEWVQIMKEEKIKQAEKDKAREEGELRAKEKIAASGSDTTSATDHSDTSTPSSETQNVKDA